MGIVEPTQTEIDSFLAAEKDAESLRLSNPKLAFMSVLEILYENSTELQAAFADAPAFAQACIDRYKSKL